MVYYIHVVLVSLADIHILYVPLASRSGQAPPDGTAPVRGGEGTVD